MPTLREYKVALKSAAMAYVAGAHAITEGVWKLKSETLPFKARSKTCSDLQNFLKALTKDQTLVEGLAELMSEEDIYPFSSEWPAETLSELVEKLKAPILNPTDAFDGSITFRFKKGFHKAVSDAARSSFAVADEDANLAPSGLDHWLSQIIDGAFHAGAIAAARAAGGGEPAFYGALSAIEEEGEAWTRYEQLARIYDNETTRNDLGDDPEDDEGYGMGGDEDEAYDRQTRGLGKRGSDYDFDADDDYGDDDDEPGHDPFGDDYED